MSLDSDLARSQAADKLSIDALLDGPQSPSTELTPPAAAMDAAGGTKRNNLEHFCNAFFGSSVKALSEPQQKAIEVLLAGERVGKVAEKVEVNRTTLWRWRQDPHLSCVLDKASSVWHLEPPLTVSGPRGIHPQLIFNLFARFAGNCLWRGFV